jgi:HEAT repeat protein
MNRIDPDRWDERQAAIVEAGRGGDVADLRAALSDPDHRYLAAKYLGDLGAEDAVHDLVRLLSAHDAVTRSAAARALGQLRAAEARSKLLSMVREDQDSRVRAWAASAVARIGGEDVLPTLAALLDADDWPLRRAGAYSLGLLGDHTCLPELRAAAARERVWRRRVFREAERRLAPDGHQRS